MLDTIYNEDCLEGMKRLPDCSVDMVLCDLPYGTTRNAWDSEIPLVPLWIHYRRLTRRRSAIVLTAQLPFSVTLAASNIECLKYEWIWEKNRPTGFLNSRFAPMKCHENVLVFSSAAASFVKDRSNSMMYIPQMEDGSPYVDNRNQEQLTTTYDKFKKFPIFNTGTRYPRTVLRFGCDQGLHPTQKPVALFEYLIRTYTNPGETVLDNCIGSGTTAIACLNTGRHYIGFEKDPNYFRIAQNRIAAYQAQALLATA